MVRLIAEVAQAHEGSLGLAKSFIDSCVKSGMSDVKFQMHFPEHESTQRDRFRLDIFPQDKTRYDYWHRTSFSKDHWRFLKDYADCQNINLVISPFSLYACELCKELGIRSIKIGSGEFFNREIIAASQEFCRELILSTGMATMQEIEEVVSSIKIDRDSLAVLQCTSMYPTPLEQTSLETIELIRDFLGVQTGLSDHSGKISTVLFAVAAHKASIVEFHVTYSREMFGPDSSSSLTFDEATRLRELLEDFETLSNSARKDDISNSLSDIKGLFTRSLVASRDLRPGEVLKDNDLAYKKPSGGLTLKAKDLLVGKTIKHSISADALLSLDDVE